MLELQDVSPKENGTFDKTKHPKATHITRPGVCLFIKQRKDSKVNLKLRPDHHVDTNP